MESMKKMFSIVLAIALLMANVTTAFATEPDNSNNEPVKHTIEITLDPNEYVDDGIMPLRYDKYDKVILKGITTQTEKFYCTERYMAFEAHATDISGNIINDRIRIELRDYMSDGILGSINLQLDGETYKLDWIDGGRGWYYFVIKNNTNHHIDLLLTYYSWA